ncbi:MAG: pantoate--beta-alanine ligase [Planctomycetia bacterium]|nr:MAG: pantoate--beta-alanine ligase [Planctomycetia bacterium]
MIRAETIRKVREVVAHARAAGRLISFVPTMGALHAGHAALLGAARADGAFTVVSIFVNPTQFGPSEDFASYPRDAEGDLRLCKQHGVDLVFLPSATEMYPHAPLTSVSVDRLTRHLCGPHRPGHFAGVATVVLKLLNIVTPDVACFGQKDAQQLAVVRRMVADLDLPVRIAGVPTVREADGLAMSSRNRRLSAVDREQALCLVRALREAERMARDGVREVADIEARMREVVRAAGPSTIDYVSVVDCDELQPIDRIHGPALAALAVRIGATRLIDNLVIGPPPDPPAATGTRPTRTDREPS